ncbi:MAG: hypothetical protein DHS20C21_19910 [Gemmatimonadota bacterium]|nr:MAG: hypothetical protein DHS20C21_19910 [Gemmatimonadota bacterium]
MMLRTVVGLVLVAMAVGDLVIGWRVVAPRATESARPKLKLASVVAASVTLTVGVLILLGTIPIGSE